MKMTDEISKAYLESKVVMKGDYPYFINPICDGNPPITKGLLESITDRILEQGRIDCDVILAPEAMAIPYASALTLRAGIPFQIIRKRSHGLPGELCFDQTTGYSKGSMYLNFIEKGTRVVVVDDVFSTGGTMRAIVQTLRSNGIIVNEVIIVLNKSRNIAAFSEELCAPIRTVIDVSVEDGKPVILSKND